MIVLPPSEDDRKGKKEEEETLHDIVEEFLSSTSAHGIARVPSERYFIGKIIWFTIFLGALGWFIYQGQKLVVQFQNYDVGVVTSYKYRDTATFPAITICNMNKLRRSKLNGTKYATIISIDNRYQAGLLNTTYEDAYIGGYEEYGSGGGSDYNYDWDYADTQSDYANYQQNYGDMGGDYDYFEEFAVDNSEIYGGLKDEYDFEKMLTYAKTDDLSDLQEMLRPSEAELGTLGHTIDDLIWQCSFDRSNCDVKANFSKSYSNLYGNCYTFNSGLTGKDLIKTTRYGSRYGLRMTLNVEKDEYLGMFTHEVGVRVTVHHNNVSAFPEDSGVNAPIERSTEIGFSTNQMNREAAPYKTNCTKTGQVDLHYNGDYTIQNCLLTCVREHLKSACGCIDTVDKTDAEYRCSFTNVSQVVCRQKVYYKYRVGKLGCRAQCRDACQEVSYDTGVSYSQWPSNMYGYLLLDRLRNSTGNSSLDLDYISTNLLRVHVYFKSLSMFAVDEYPAYTWDRLLADIGGTLGLFIGVSVCTICEFIEFLIFVCIWGFKKMFGHSHKKVSAITPDDEAATHSHGLPPKRDLSPVYM